MLFSNPAGWLPALSYLRGHLSSISNHNLLRGLAAAAAHRLYRSHNVHSLHHLAKHHCTARQEVHQQQCMDNEPDLRAPNKEFIVQRSSLLQSQL